MDADFKICQNGGHLPEIWDLAEVENMKLIHCEYVTLDK